MQPSLVWSSRPPRLLDHSRLFLLDRGTFPNLADWPRAVGRVRRSPSLLYGPSWKIGEGFHLRRLRFSNRLELAPVGVPRFS